MKDKLINYLISGLPISVGTLGSIRQPTIKELISNDINIDTFIQPFIISKDVLEADKENPFYEQIKNFDLMFLEQLVVDGKPILALLVDSLKFIYDIDEKEISIVGQIITIKSKNVFITRDNFDTLSEIILSMFNREKPKPKPKPKYKNDYQKKIMEKLNKKREEQAKKKMLHLCDYINAVAHFSNTPNYAFILDLTYYQLINSFNILRVKENYEDYLKYLTSSKFEIKDKTNHWITDIKNN